MTFLDEDVLASEIAMLLRPWRDLDANAIVSLALRYARARRRAYPEIPDAAAKGATPHGAETPKAPDGVRGDDRSFLPFGRSTSPFPNRRHAGADGRAEACCRAVGALSHHEIGRNSLADALGCIATSRPMPPRRCPLTRRIIAP